MPHVIRLRAPWHRETATGRVRWRRRFGCPTGLRPDTVVRLVIGAATAPGAVWLDGQPLGPLDDRRLPVAYEVTRRLHGRHEILIELEGEGETIDEVRLEIDPA